ncbi:MAG: serine protein kinase, partial [Pseudomonadota bacterium]
MANNGSLVKEIATLQDAFSYADLTWEGSFDDYLEIVKQDPRVVRSAFQRIYDMILSHGREEYMDAKKKLVRFSFFRDEQHGGRDAIYGLDIPLMKLVNILRSAAHGYGTERRVILLHGPVGSSKSTIARLLKGGLEEYSHSPDGKLYTFRWHLTGDAVTDPNKEEEDFPCPMNEEPLKIIPIEWRAKALEKLGINETEYA